MWHVMWCYINFRPWPMWPHTNRSRSLLQALQSIALPLVYLIEQTSFPCRHPEDSATLGPRPRRQEAARPSPLRHFSLGNCRWEHNCKLCKRTLFGQFSMLAEAVYGAMVPAKAYSRLLSSRVMSSSRLCTVFNTWPHTNQGKRWWIE